MKRRRFIQTVASVSALPAGLAAQEEDAVDPSSVLALADIDAAGDPQPSFFTPAQFAALTRLSDLLMPPYQGLPGAITASAPAFLDFLIGESPEKDQAVYISGLDALNYQAAMRFDQPFAAVEESQAHELLAPLREPWSPEPSSDPLTVFLKRAKSDVRIATVNTKLWAEAFASRDGGRRRLGGGGQYWKTVE